LGDASAKVLPAAVDVDDRFYGFRMAVPTHEWPSFTADPGWYQTRVTPSTDRATVTEADSGGRAETRVAHTLTVTGRQTGRANAVRIGGVADPAQGIELSATDTINGDKVLDLPEPIDVAAGTDLTLDVSYVHSGGLSSSRCEVRPSSG
jgi:hypothetical protein